MDMLTTTTNLRPMTKRVRDIVDPAVLEAALNRTPAELTDEQRGPVPPGMTEQQVAAMRAARKSGIYVDWLCPLKAVNSRFFGQPPDFMGKRGRGARLPKRGLNSEFVDRLHEHAKVMAENLAQDLVNHRDFRFGADTAAEFGLYHVKGGFHI